MLESPTVIPGALDEADELGDNPPSNPLDPKRSESRFPAELVLEDVADAEPLVIVGVIEGEIVGSTMLVGRPVVEPTAAVVLVSNKLPMSLPKAANQSADDEVVESAAAAVVTGLVMVFV